MSNKAASGLLYGTEISGAIIFIRFINMRYASFNIIPAKVDTESQTECLLFLPRFRWNKAVSTTQFHIIVTFFGQCLVFIVEHCNCFLIINNWMRKVFKQTKNQAEGGEMFSALFTFGHIVIIRIFLFSTRQILTGRFWLMFFFIAFKRNNFKIIHGENHALDAPIHYFLYSP